MSPILVRQLQLHLLSRQVLIVTAESAVAFRRGEQQCARNLEAQKTQLQLARAKLLKGGAL